MRYPVGRKRALLALAVALLVGASSLFMSSARTQPPTRAAVVAARVESHYRAAKRITARFEQTTVFAAQAETKVRTGRLALTRAGNLSFRYDGSADRVVFNGKLLRTYVAADELLYERSLRGNEKTALTRWFAADALSERFSLRTIETHDQPGTVLVAEPKRADPTLAQLVLHVADDGSVSRLLVVDAQGNTNRFVFSDVRIDPDVPASEFRFRAPNGTTVVKP